VVLTKRDIIKEALQKVKAKSYELVEKTKSMPQIIKQGIEDKNEAQEATQIALSTKGVWAVKSFFVIE